MTPITKHNSYSTNPYRDLLPESNILSVFYSDITDCSSEFKIIYNRGDNEINLGREIVSIKEQWFRSLSSLKRAPEFSKQNVFRKSINRSHCQKNGDIKKRFEELAQEWQSDIEFLSDINEIALHSAHQRIIGMGPKIIPLILDKIEKKPSYWFWALKSITGEDPVPPKDRGNIIKMTQHWLEWGRKNGYRN